MARYPLVCAGVDCATPDAPLGWADLPDDHDNPAKALHGYLCAACGERYRTDAAELELEHAAELDKKLAALPKGLDFLADAVALLHGPAPAPPIAVAADAELEPDDPRRRLAFGKPAADDWTPPGYDRTADELEAAEEKQRLADLELELAAVDLEAAPEPS